MIHSADELQAYARAFLARLSARADGATIVTLSGELGAGKTTFTQSIARALGITETVASPTFIIEKIYQLAGQQWERLIHIDAYRLKSAHELEVIGWREISVDPANLIMLEWPEQVPGAIPTDAIRLRFEIHGEGRIITSDGAEDSQESGEKSAQSGAEN